MKTRCVDPEMNASSSCQPGFRGKDARALTRFISPGLSIVLAVALIATVGAPSQAWAGFATVKTMTSDEYYVQCKSSFPYSFWFYGESLIYDPAAQSVTGFSQTIQYNPLYVAFDPSHSGPLGVFSVGGDAPPPDPGIGTQPVQLLPTSGFTAGAPLPGATLTYTNVNGFLTINYELASPISVSGDINFFRVDFKLLHPVPIDLSRSSVTYETTGPGADFSTVSYSCTTSAGNQISECGSDNPATGITTSFDVVPEPSSLLLLGSGVLGLSGFLRKRLLART